MRRDVSKATSREQEEHNRSLLRLYGELDRANSYRDVVDALRPEVLESLGYENVWLELAGVARGDSVAESD